ncbi:PREDICTED: UPF0481 protein At3g47200-like [Nelumbo nucifera]|uniref:Uncharacterized protein n=2 Tax=Nelumbo nucifera TaxID=4432 RepID=A0A822ZI67_NELNU|nr:PREDICTED: UPF0481 protein At3g47200-like [Nelumbo nucifera]DAD43165.1 TPA_asm: hypothetical protein HUJ06_001395 [Nelumbo nucifera]
MAEIWSSLSSNLADEDWIITIKEEQEAARTVKPWIPLVPENMRKEPVVADNKTSAYDPEVVTIGPYHHGKKEAYNPMQEHKKKIVPMFVSEGGKNVKIEDLLSKVGEISPNARNYYNMDSINNIDDQVFRRMMFLDGCFVAYFIYCMTKGKSKNLNMENKTIISVARDLFLLENQLPYPVLKVLMESVFPPPEKKWREMIDKFVVMQVIGVNFLDTPQGKGAAYLNRFFGKSGYFEPHTSHNESDEPHHLLDLLRTKLVVERENQIIRGPQSIEANRQPQEIDHPMTESSQQRSDEPDVSQVGSEENNSYDDGKGFRFEDCICCCILLICIVPLLIYYFYDMREKRLFLSHSHQFRTARELKAVGISFKISNSLSFRSVKFKPGIIFGVLKLPRILIDHTAEVRFLNLIAYERSCFDLDDFMIASYICFLDWLIDHANDVKELRSDHVLINNLGSDEEAAHLINRLGRDLMDPDVYDEDKENIQKFCRKKRRTWFAEMQFKHCSSPWTIIALIAASMALFFSAVQAYFTVYPRS